MLKLFLLCVLLHLVADYTLQGCLANMKQRSWWDNLFNQYPDKDTTPYKYDYKCALFCHALYWTLITFAPILFCINITSDVILGVVIINTAIHYTVDDLKANKFMINLWTDQIFHFVQIGITVLLVCLCCL